MPLNKLSSHKKIKHPYTIHSCPPSFALKIPPYSFGALGVCYEYLFTNYLNPRNILLILPLIFFSYQSTAQNFDKACSDAYLITKMADKFHLKPRCVNDSFSSFVWYYMLENTDFDKIIFTKNDIEKLSTYIYNIDNDILGQKSNFLAFFYQLYNERLQQSDSIAANIGKTRFDLHYPDTLTKNENLSSPTDLKGIKNKLYKYFKADVLSYLLPNLKSIKKGLLNKTTDSLEAIYRKKTIDSYRIVIKKQLQSPGGLTEWVGNLYCRAVANAYDPHTEYFTQSELENFESEVGRSTMEFGFDLGENKHGGVRIKKILRNSPADKSGLIKKGDKILTVQWEKAQPIDLSTASLEDILDILDADNHAKATFTLISPNGIKKYVTLSKESCDEDNETERLLGYLLDGEKKFGYIYLPSFYEGWDEKGDKGCANETRKIIAKLEGEKISGLVLDLRGNGGGSIKEALDIASIFVGKAPLLQEKKREGLITAYHGIEYKKIYTGPMVVLVDGYSASASELLASTLQDLHRALLVGSTTYGKATSQAILPLDTTISLEDTLENNKKAAYLKITVSQLYRLTGASSQAVGVTPDIVLPDATCTNMDKERDSKNILPADSIPPIPIVEKQTNLPIGWLKEASNKYKSEDDYYKDVLTFIEKTKETYKVDKLILNLSTFLSKDSLGLLELYEEPDFEDRKLKKQWFAIKKIRNDRIAGNIIKTSNIQEQHKLTKDANLIMAFRLLKIMNVKHVME